MGLGAVFWGAAAAVTASTNTWAAATGTRLLIGVGGTYDCGTALLAHW